ncbi:hypothetical protein A3D81_01025 [Candidatus Curtissbacteria bacterium RIFCSPHIGHO2_02_FULL_40_17]|uniref:Glycosyltransferase RgtA/B/C/D-like domain-containing protein n=4 Tax=Bacteria candidate phyla TaxID=1783234 RepID=A0A1F5GHN8_9BACT|nr:MAG: hypothetical protein A3H26_01430 [candidate division WWE3 bacterium RIFCSPLOWO2_12_FULL_36_10]OGD87330.1 MAG: hypothetical protein A2693_03305 [Candidatus Curtissbacteria bacterium RIFCSPHIGHO2_01_FULL_40_12]OGD91365.1 MAG: hypothetical protein A3D81_01025 [Candidatus Curtissbacteria bacterium RIFCSPHIGHO2_02_FULL_40_17]OGE04021.1 MAG: hypothetical protein A3F45_02710 [Candidatus Curtissbacteria bacterium RIFCSPHIGHO2_12_FULL_41_17]
MRYSIIQKFLLLVLAYKKKTLQMLKSDKNIYLFLLAVFFVVLTIMLPFKDQLFSEDFAYAQSVRHFINTGDLKISERVVPTSITHIIWGTVVTKFLGLSLANLHFSVVLLLPFLLFALYKLFSLIGCNKEKSFIFTIFFFSIPWILQLSYTFTTDIPFLILEVFAILFYIQGFKENKTTSLLIGSIFASLAFLTRQLGILLAFAAFVTVILSSNSKNQKIKNALLSLGIPLLTLFLYLWWLSFPENKTIAQLSTYRELKETYFYSFALNILIENLARIIHTTLNLTSQALGLLFPIILLLLLTNLKRVFNLANKNKRRFTVATIVAVIIYAIDIINFRKEYTVGFPFNIYQYENLLPVPWAHIWKYIVLISLPILSCTIYLQYKNVIKLNNYQRFISLSFVFLAIPTVIHVAKWDIYIIPFLPLSMLWIASSTKKFTLNLKLSLVVVLILLLDSVQMTKLRYNESALIWEKAMKLVDSGISPAEIDPSNNFGWYYWFYYEKLASDSIKSNDGNKDKSDYGFVIAKPDLPKYRIYTERMIRYSSLNTTNYKVQTIPLRSFLVNSKIYFMQLDERY